MKRIAFGVIIGLILTVGTSVAYAVGAFPVATGGTGATSFGQGFIYSSGGTTALTASTSAITVDHVNSTSTTATSSFAYGIKLSGGCFAMPNGTCVGAGGGSGTVTSVASTNGIAGGTITTSGTLYLTNFFASSSGETNGQLPYWTTTNGTPAKFGSIATTSHAFSGPFSVTGTIGALVGGVNSTVNWTGLATTSQPSSSQLLESNGSAGVFGISTSSLGVTGPITFSGTLGAQVGGANGSFGCATCLTANQSITLTGAVSGTGATSIATTFNYTPWGGSILGGAIASTTGFLSEASSTVSGGLFTATNASTTALSATGYLQAPAAASSPSLTVAGQHAFNDTTASSSLRWYDGTAIRSLYAEVPRSINLASSTLAYQSASYGASGTTTLLVMNNDRPMTLLHFYCKTDANRVHVDFSTGSTHTIDLWCSPSGIDSGALASNNTYTIYQDFKINVGTATTTPNNVTVTYFLRNDSD